MARLIDADALEQEIIKEYYTANNPSSVLTKKGEAIFNAAIDVARCRIADADTVDVAPVVHGRWIHGITLGHEWRKCSECLVSQEIFGCFTHCPNCGAKMDGGSADVCENHSNGL